MILCCGRVILISINLVFFLVASALIVLGLILRFGDKIHQDLLSGTIDELKASAKDVFLMNQDLDTSDIDMDELFNTIAIVATVLGFAFLGFCFKGLCGACYKNKCMLITYVVIVSILVVVQIAFVTLALTIPNTLKSPIKAALKTTLNDYHGLNGTDAKTITWNILMIQFDCCGANDYEDFKNHQTWWGVSEFLTPIACCKNLPASRSAADRCAGTPSSATSALQNSAYDTGCVDAVWSWVENHSLTLTILVASLILQVVLIIFGILVAYYADKDKVEPEEEWIKRQSHRRQDPRWD